MIKNFLDYLRFELNRAPLTVEAYETDILQFQKWLCGDNVEKADFSSVTSSDIRAWLSSLSRKGESPRTLRRKIISLRSFYKWMLKSGFIKSTPLRDISLPKISKPLPNVIKPDEIENALENFELSEDKTNEETALNSLIVEMLYTMGIRRAELIGINDSDISSDKYEIKVTGKRSKQRIIPIPPFLLDKIKEWQTLRDTMKNNPKGTEDPLFRIKGSRISPNKVYRIVHEALSGSTARKKSPHALRHSFATGMLNSGANMDSVKEFLGHASLATTQIYTHISLNEIKKAYSQAHPRSSKK